jgi:hypothetical protein
MNIEKQTKIEEAAKECFRLQTRFEQLGLMAVPQAVEAQEAQFVTYALAKAEAAEAKHALDCLINLK